MPYNYMTAYHNCDDCNSVLKQL